MTGNFLAAIASHHSLLSNQRDIKQWLLESMQWAKASDVQRKDMQVGLSVGLYYGCGQHNQAAAAADSFA
jgi:hypothetical protein